MNSQARRLAVLVGGLTFAAIAAAAVAQPGAGGGRGGGGGQPGQPGGQPGRPGGGAGGGGEGMIERLMRFDTNGDGKLQWDEVPEAQRERLFERGDTNNDKVLDQEELRAMAAAGPRRQGPGAGGGEGGSAAGTLHDAMEQAGRAMRTLRRSQFSEMSRRQDLSSIQSLQAALVACKGLIHEAKMSEPAKAKFKDDTAAFQREFRLTMIKTAIKAFELERAIVNGDSAGATRQRDELLALQKEAHDLFQPDAENEGDGAPPPRREPGGPGRPGGGRPPN
ncbi:MAG: hypothetical protein KF869_03950 [Phycisphaeraceae bacterium]|nr:hypothetical protein [Phycisphaeraceae bacterium]